MNDDADHAHAVWPGVAPVTAQLGAPEADPRVAPGTPPSPAALALAGPRL